MNAQYAGRTAWARNLAAPVRDFLRTETAGAAALLGATVAALLWANSPWWESYESVWHTELSIRLGGDGIAMDLRHWVNEGLMTFFFLVVGLEAKRELDMGELRERRRVAIPLIAAAGGMLAPVAIYLAFNAGGPGAGGWGAAMSTDTAFALGVLALVASGATRLRVRLLTIVVIDDLVALLVIATVYTEDVSLLPLAVAFALFAALVALRYAPAGWRMPAALALGLALWAALHKSGIDPVIAGLAAGLVTSAYPPARERPRAGDRADALVPRAAHPRAGALGTAERGVRDLGQRAAPAQAPPLDRLRDRAAVRARERGNPRGRRPAGATPSRRRSRWGSCSATWSASRSGSSAPSGSRSRPWLGGLRRSLSWPTIVGGGAVAGIGFTISLLISTQAFTGQRPGRGQARACSAPPSSRRSLSWIVFRVIARLPASIAGAAARRHSRRAARPGRRRRASATTSAVPWTRR